MSHADDAPLGMPLTLNPLEVHVDRDVLRAMKRLKRLVNQEGVLKDLKKRRAHAKPSVRRREKQRMAERNRRKRERRRLV